MGLLDDLRNQADSQRASEEEKAAREANREQFYLDKIQPRMIKTYQFFKEFAEHLNYIELETIVNYPLLPGGAPQSLRQGNYKVVIDSSKALRRIDFSMEGVLDEPVEFEIFGKDAVLNHSERIKRYSFRHEYKDRKGVDQYIKSAKFVLQGPLPLKVTVEADVATSEIRLTIRNFIEPGFTKHTLTVEEFSDEFLDKLGNFVLRKEACLIGGEDITDEAKKQIRDRMIVEARIRQQELIEAEALRKAEEAAEKENSPKEQIKRVVSEQVEQQKEKLKGMFNKLKKQAGLDSTSTDQVLPPVSAAVKPQANTPQPPVQKASTQKAPAQPASVAAKRQTLSPKRPSPSQKISVAQAPIETKTSTQQTVKQSKPSVAVSPGQQPPTTSAVAKTKNSQPPKIYKAPGNNPFINPNEPVVPSSPEPSAQELKSNPEPKQNNNEGKNKPASESAAAASSRKLVLTPEDLERDLTSIMQRDTLENPEIELPDKESDSVPSDEPESVSLAADLNFTAGEPDIDLSAIPSQVDTGSEDVATPTTSEAPEPDLVLELADPDADEPLPPSEEESSSTLTPADAPEPDLTLEPAEPDTEVSLKSMFPKVDKIPEEKS